MILPPPRILYTDVNGGQILGYTEDDMRWAMGLPRANRETPLPARCKDAVDAYIAHGSVKGAARALGRSTDAVASALRDARRAFKCRTTTQLCTAYAAGSLTKTPPP